MSSIYETMYPGSTKEMVIRYVAENIAKELNLDSEVLVDLLIDRENLQPNTLNNGIAIPDARDFLITTLQDLVLIMFPEKPISYGALDAHVNPEDLGLLAGTDSSHLQLLGKRQRYPYRQKINLLLNALLPIDQEVARGAFENCMP